MSLTSPFSASSGAGIALGARLEIFPGQPLPELNRPGAMAYAAKMRGDSGSDLFALICAPGLPPRIDTVAAMRLIDHPHLLRLLEAGVVPWANGVNAYALVYQRPLAPRMMASLGESHAILSEDILTHHFITPMIHGLLALSNAGVVHNAINPGTIFWRIGNAAPPQIGDCLSGPAGLHQPIIFEPIERSLALPIGRGVGFAADDCYAFGMIVALLALGRNPFHGMDEASVIDLKIQRGSFAAVIGAHRLSQGIIELLRGLLADDRRHRWNAADLEQWLNGRRMTPKNSDQSRRAARHFNFAGKDYWQLAPLAQALAKQPDQAAPIIENETLGKWLRRALNDPERAEAISASIKELKQSGKTVHYEDQLTARCCLALDPAAPIRYRGLAVMPAGIASMLVEATLTEKYGLELAEIISGKLVSVWVEMQRNSGNEYISMLQLFERMKSLVDRPGYGNGIERVTYELNPGLPCLSPMVRNAYVTTPKMLLPALEQIAAHGNRPREPMDRHIAAFLIARDKRGEGLFSAMNAPEGSLKRGLGLLGLFADLHYRHGPGALPKLAAWLAPAVEPALRRYLGKKLREQLQKKFKETVEGGNLTALLGLIEDTRMIERDHQEFLAARMLYLSTQKEIAGLEIKLAHRDKIVSSAGKPMAASISAFLAIVLVCAAITRVLIENLLQ